MKKSIVWLASYPKSGNTWARMFVANYVMNLKEPLPINEIRRFGTGDSITHHYNRIAKRKVDPNDFNLTLKLRTPFLRAIVKNNADVNLVKTHNIRNVVFGVDLIPEEFTRSAIYIIRNPLDMVMSYARHYNISVDDAAHAIGRSDNTTAGDAGAVTQFLGTWSEHIKSWTSKVSYPTALLRYEDMLASPEASFAKLVEHMGMPVEKDRLKRAIEFSSFKVLAAQEAETGFGERSEKSERFFDRGTSGHWRDDLDPTIIKKIRLDHKMMMKKYGYWNE